MGIIWHESLDSTNAEVRRQLPALDNLSVVATKMQTAGRGQGDHRWSSEPGKNLTFTLLRRFPEGTFPARNLAAINHYVTGVLTTYLKAHGVEAWVKPPNDIWVADRKICGILIENILDGTFIRESIIGVGLDLNQTQWPPELPNPVSLKELTGQDYSPEKELETLLTLFAATPLEARG